MEPGGGDCSSQSPGRSFDAANLLGASPFGPVTTSSTFGPLSQMPSAFSMLGRLPMFPPAVPFGGLGSISDPLRSPSSLSQPLSPTPGGAEWWHMASEHARRMAMGCPGPDYLTGLNGGVSEASMFQLPSFSTTTTTTTTTTSASSSTGGATKSGTTTSTTSSTPTKTISTPSKSDEKDKDRERRTTPSNPTRYKEKKRHDSSSSDQSKDSRTHKSSKDWSKNPLSVESLTNAESASAVMGVPPFFFPFGTVANSLPPFSGLPFTSPFLPEVSSVYSSAGLFPTSSLELFQSYPSPSIYSSTTPSKSSSTKSTSLSKSLHSVISSSKNSRPTEHKSTSEHKSSSEHKTLSSEHRTSSSSSLYSSKTKDGDTYRERVLSPKSPHMSVITPVPKSPVSSGQEKRHRLDQSAIEAMDRRYGSRRSPRFDRTSHQHRSESTRHESSQRESTRAKDIQSSPQNQSEPYDGMDTNSALNLSISSNYSADFSSQDGVMDLSMKKPRSTSASSISPAISNKSKDKSSSTSSSAKTTSSLSKSVGKSSSQSVLTSTESALSRYDPAALASSLLSYPGAADALTASALMEAQKEFLEKHAAGLGLFPPGLMSGAGGKMAADMSYNYAAAAAAAMMPPFYDGMAGMFMHPMMASMAAAAIPQSSTQSSPPPSGRGRGRGRGGRSRGGRGSGRGNSHGRGSSNSLSSPMMSMFKAPDPPPPNDTGSRSSDGPRRGRGGGRGRGRGRGRRGGRSSNLESSSSSSSINPPHFMGLPLAELEWQQQRLRQEQLRHQLEVEMKQQQMQMKLAQRAQALRDKDSKTSDKMEINSQGLSSRLAQALMGGESVPGTSQKSSSYLNYKTKSVSDETSASGTGEDFTGSGSETDSQSALDSEGSEYKRRHGDEYDPNKKKRRRTIFDESELRIPIEHGWRRETKIRAVNERGIFGEVIYFTPCGKKLRTYPEVEKYMNRNNITDLTRENFTFSTQVSVGDFYEYAAGAPGEGYVLLSEAEVLERYVIVEAKRKRIFERKMRMERRKDRKRLAEEMARRMAESRLQKKVEQQGNNYDLARKVEEIKMRKKAERQQQQDAIRRAKQVRVLELKKLRERQRLMKQQEKVQKQRQLQMEREMRAQQAVQVMKVRQKRKEELQSMRFAEAIRKAQEKELKRQVLNIHKDQPALSTLLQTKSVASCTSSSAVLTSLAQNSQNSSSAGCITMANTAPSDMYYTYLMAQAAQQERTRQQHMLKMLGFEKERRRQHLLLLKAMDARKKLEEKERQKEEKKAEKRQLQQRKLEQRRLELEIAREMKKPVEDMKLKDSKELPEIARIPGVRLPGEVLADCLMVVEFMQNFGSCLGYDAGSLPTLNMIQGGLLNDPYHVDDLNMFVMQLLRNALDDPGVPNPREATTVSGQKIMEVDLNEHSISEVLSIFIRCRNGRPDEMSSRLRDHPFQSLTHTHKAAILAFLCNELLCGKNISGEIDKNIESINNLRRDKWIVEGKLRKMKMIQAKRFRKAEMTKVQQEGSIASNMDADDSCSLAPLSVKNKKQSDDEEDNESGHESDHEPLLISDDDEEQSLTNEELEKKIEKFSKQHSSFNDKVTNTSNKLRAINLGQDRYKRRYWVLPHCGGVFVEGMESGEFGSEASNRATWLEYEKNEAKVKSEQTRTEVKVEGQGQIEEIVKEEEYLKVKAEVNVRGEDWDALKAVNVDMNGVSEVKQVGDLSELQNGAKQEGDLGGAAKSITSSVPTTVTTTATDTIVNGINVNTKDEQVFTKDNQALSDKFKLPKSPHLVNGDSGTVPLVNGTLLPESTPNLLDTHFVPPPPLIPFKSSLIKEIIDKNIMEKFSGKDDIPVVNGVLTDNCDLKSSFKVKDIDLKVMDLTTKVKDHLNDLKPDLGNHGLQKDCERLDELIRSVKSENVCSQSDSKMGVKSSPLKVPVLKSPLLSGMSYRSIDSILSTESKPALSSPGANVYSKSNSSSSNVCTSSPQVSHDHLMKNMSVAVNNSGELLFQNNKPTFSPWISLLPRKPCDNHSVTGHNRFATPTKISTPRCTSQSFNSPLNNSLYSSFDFSHLASPVSSTANTPSSSTVHTPMFSNPGTPIPMFLAPGEIDHTSPIYMLQQLQHTNAQPIEFEKQKNWWKICDVETLKEVMRCLHLRGIRERSLQKTIERFMDLACQSITKGKKDVVKLDVCSKTEGLPMPEDPETWHCDIKREVELSVLDEVENMEDRICHASLQVKGFKMPPKVKMTDMSQLVSQDVLEPDEGQQYILDVARTKLLALERNIERRYLKPPFVKSMRLSLASLTSTPPKEHPRDRDRDREDDTKDLEDGHQEEGDMAHTDQADLDGQHQQEFETETDGSRHLPKELTRWRESVMEAESGSQIMVYMLQLNDCISWEKSIMKVSCQICCHDDNEAELLLCDSCDKGYHTYCFKPRMDDIPDGDWYCYECISRATGEACCVVCGKAGTKLAECEYCPRSMHTDCMDPPMARCPKKWCCAACTVERVRGKGLKRKKSRLTSMSSFTAIKDHLSSGANLKVTEKPAATSQVSETKTSNVASPAPAAKPEPSPDKKEKKKRKRDKDQQKDADSKSPKAKVKKPKKEKKSPEKPVKEKKTPKEKKKRKSNVVAAVSENDAVVEAPPKKKRKKKKKNKEADKIQVPGPVIVLDSQEEEVVENKEEEKLAVEEVLTDSMDEAKLVIDLGSESSATEETPVVMEDSTDLAPCVCMMDELEKHEEAWPFLQPVDCRRFPSYRKFIKKPMDFQTMGHKLRDNIYQSREEFANDLRLVCDNCVTFNEDDSAVGRAGHAVREFFEKRWKELCINSIGNDLS